ncbi:MAG: hypothetical protein HN742_21300 [Lentisphaerae bacterium]|jgi:hypothetical protein|nr:hypothetical protein [Lentisphaerota bacterium]MBT4816544.1 hypothetical protein [Lentisphaerota bacterium]MBT5605689.1 hypothetical protein [Lentisphaerota bacterium]MBT7060521.1 hypothetical protein [Lentisphaerota bacterium]MBT7844428.1 hypothetical protein [Lentisphaerota bacterium]
MVPENIPELPFEHFLCFEEVAAFAAELARSCPELVTLSTIGESREGRPLQLLTITDSTTGPATEKPAYLIHGNIHAAELSGTHAALFTARQLVIDHANSDLLTDIAFYIIPRINPDGAEFVVTTSGTVRSRTDRTQERPNTLYQQDLNGDGLILTMRIQHPDGPLALDPDDPRLLVRRRKDTPPPYYRTLPEGLIHDWDGGEAITIEGRGFDWNRNWSYDWRPEPEQHGAGDYPFSEPEMRALAEFIHSHPKIFGILGYHNGPNGTLRPPSTGADTDLDQGDVLRMQELAEIGEKHTGFPVIPVVKYHRATSRDINLRGHFHNFGYHHLGLFVFEFELGTLVNSAGIKTEEIFAVSSDQEYEALMRRVLAWWDEQTERDQIFRAWTPFEHPQLGLIELGGLLGRHMAGPTLKELRTIAANTYRFTLDHAGDHPKVVVEDVCAEHVDGTVYRIRARVANRGQFPTHITNKGRSLRRLQTVQVAFYPGSGVRLVSAEGHRNLGHLPGLTGSRVLEWFIAAEGAGEDLCTVHVDGGTGGNTAVTIPRPSCP